MLDPNESPPAPAAPTIVEKVDIIKTEQLPSYETPVTNRPSTNGTIKRVKPTFMHSLRPEDVKVADDDIRLTYARLFFNLLNGCATEDIQQVLLKCCVDNCEMSVKWIGERGKRSNIYYVLYTVI